MSYLPTPDSFFPTTRRGHGSTHPENRFIDGVLVRKGNRCVQETCVLHGKRGEAHTGGNLDAWKSEHHVKEVPW